MMELGRSLGGTWKLHWFQVEFVCNSMVNQSTSRTPFEIFYTCSLCHICDMAIIPLVAGERRKIADNMAEKVLQIHVGDCQC